MDIAVTDYTFSDLDYERAIIEPLGWEISAWKENRDPLVLADVVSRSDAVITQFATVNADVINRMDRARVIVRYGIGVDNVDLDAAQKRGIPVCNIPDYCIDEVADHTLAFILAATRQVVPNDQILKNGTWGAATSADQMKALRDLTVGVVGFGRIGREVVARLVPFKPRILVFDPVARQAEILQAGAQPVSLNDLLKTSDLVTLHCPSTAQTRGMINRESIQSLKRGAILVNLSRGNLIESDALVAGLQSGHIAAAALDVFETEPLPSDHPLLSMSNVTVASHLASISAPAVRKLRETAARLVVKALKGEPLPNVVNGVPHARQI